MVLIIFMWLVVCIGCVVGSCYVLRIGLGSLDGAEVV
jgi:hypothetical protein